MAVRNPQLLDTGTVSNLLGLPQGKVATRITKVGEVKVCTSIVVACELRFGAAMNAQFDAVLSARDVSQCEEPADRYAELRRALERVGWPFGPNDILISVHTLALELTVVPGKAREFSQVPRGVVENWL